MCKWSVKRLVDVQMCKWSVKRLIDVQMWPVKRAATNLASLSFGEGLG